MQQPGFDISQLAQSALTDAVKSQIPSGMDPVRVLLNKSKFTEVNCDISVGTDPVKALAARFE